MRRALPLLVLGLTGCPSESLDDVLARRRAGVEATFASIRAAQAAVLALPPVTEAALATAGPKLDLRTNAAFVHVEDLAAPGEAKGLPVRTFDSQALLHCSSLLTKKTFFDPLHPRVSVKAADATLGRCVDLRYLLVIRGARYESPTADEEQRTFTPGTFEGDVVVFDLSSRRAVGGFPFSVSNERKLQVPEAEPQLARLLRNLDALLYTQLRERLEALVPGAVPASPL